MQIHANALPLFEHSQTLPLAMQTRIFNRKASPCANGQQKFNLPLLKVAFPARGHTHHPNNTAPGCERHTGDRAKSCLHHRGAQIPQIFLRIFAGQGFACLGHDPDVSLPKLESLAGPKSVGGFSPVQSQAQAVPTLLRQENLTGFHLQVFHYAGQGLIQDLIHFHVTGQRRG